MFSSREKVLKEIAENFAMISNVTVSIHDANQKPIASGSESIPFCQAVREHSVLSQKCKECDDMGFKGCTASKKPYLYHCHMGLVEITAPIMFGDTLIGYIIIGQFADRLDKTQITQAVKKAANKYGFCGDNLLANIDAIPCPGEGYITALHQLIEMCASYIWLKNILDLKGDDLALEIKLYITNHLSEELTVDILCNKYGLSQTALYQLFKRSFGSGVIGVIRNERIARAKELLKQPKISISDVAEQVGIQDANYFTRTFKAVTGITPMEYKKSLD